MRRYFITGGTGFCGRAIVRHLLKSNETERITLLTRDAQKRYEMLSWDKRIGLFEGDITTTDFPYDDDYTHIIHGANEANDLLQPDAHRYYYTIVEGTRRIVEWSFRKTKAEFLFLSSGAVSRDTVYGRAKSLSEIISLSSIPMPRIARIYSVLGEEMPLNGQYAAGIFVHQALHAKRVRCVGGESIRAYMHVDECASDVIAMFDGPHGIYDVCGGPPIKIRALAELVAEVFDVPYEWVDDPYARKDVYIPSNDYRAHSISCWTVRESLERIRDHYKNRNT